MSNELIKITTKEDGQRLVSARELHEGLEIKTRFNDWFKRMCEYGFEEEVDYMLSSRKKRINNPKNPTCKISDYMMSLNMVKDICRKQRRNKKAPILLEYLLSLDDKEIFYIEPSKKEHEFGEMLDKITGFIFKKQYCIDGGKYRLDFYLPNTLIVEYDENHHKYQKESDEGRMKFCREWLRDNDGDFWENWLCPVIRVNEGEELEGLNRIIRHLAGFECFDTQYNYNLQQVCDIGIN